MTKLLRSRGLSAAIGLAMLGVGTSAGAQSLPGLNVSAAVRAVEAQSTAKPLGTTAEPLMDATVRPAIAISGVTAPAATAVLQTQSVDAAAKALAPTIATEAAWLYKNGWPLYALVTKYSTSAPLDEETNCLATAVYFEARGESLEGQLAVARVVINRAASGRYRPDWCGVVKQPAQFSFVRNGQFPQVNTDCDAWRKAEAIAELAAANIVPSVSEDVLWYHADYVAPSWGHRLSVVEKIGAHIFYRA